MIRALISSFLLLASFGAAQASQPIPVKAAAVEQFSFAQMCDMQLGMGKSDMT